MELSAILIFKLVSSGRFINYMWVYFVGVDPSKVLVRQHAEVPSPGVTPFIGFAAQAKLARFASVEASALHALPFGDAMGAQGTGV